MIARKIYEWVKQSGLAIQWGKGSSYGAFYPVTGASSKKDMFAVRSDGKIELILDNLNPPYHEARQREAMVSCINGINTALSIRSSGYPSFALTLLRDEKALASFLSIYEGYATVVKSSK